MRRCSWWVPAVRGECFFMKYGGSFGGSLLSGGGIIILRVIIRRHFLAAVVDQAVSLSMWASTTVSSPAPRRPLPRPRRRPLPWCSRRGVVNVVKERLPSEVYCTWRVSAGSTAAASKCLLITRKIMIPPPDSRDPPNEQPYFAKKRFPPDCWDPPATSSHAQKCVRAKKMIRPLTIGTHQLQLRTQGKVGQSGPTWSKHT